MIVLLVLISQVQLADSLYINGYFEEARVEYLRVFFFYPELRQDPALRARHVISMLKEHPAKGISELYSLVHEFPDLQDSIKVEIASQFVKSGNYYLAIDLLKETAERDMLGFAYLLDGQFSNARATFIEYGQYEIAAQIDQYLMSPKKSEGTATLLSLFLPGSGQIYSGNPWLGFRDFFFNLGSGYLFYNALRQQKYVDAVLVFFFLINRFYLGSLHNARKSAMEYNEKMHEEWLGSLLENNLSDLKQGMQSDTQP